MSITRADVEHVAQLARLGLSEDEKAMFEHQLSRIMGTMSVLDRVDTSAIAPTAQVVPLSSVMRDDVVEPSLGVDQALANAPSREGDFLRVLPVLE
jgi:aspartyl-tRNA(Asn)/glutamyl-tRNA(Gln) amidotransferase subunit C